MYSAAGTKPKTSHSSPKTGGRGLLLLFFFFFTLEVHLSDSMQVKKDQTNNKLEPALPHSTVISGKVERYIHRHPGQLACCPWVSCESDL